jgi:subtilisin family serine protease
MSASARGADHVIVETTGGEASDLATRISALGGLIERRLPQVNVIVVKGLSASAVGALASRTDVAHVTADVRVRWIPSSARLRTVTAERWPVRPPSAPIDQSGAFFYSQYQWNMRVTKANQAWRTTPEGQDTRVYVLDTGIDPSHQDLAGKVDLAKSRSFAEAEPNDISDYESHGTFVSAIITSNGLGVASVAPKARIVAVKVLDASGSGSWADVISGILYAADQGADVINMSLGALVDASDPGTQPLLERMQAAIAYARLQGAVVVASAGNDALDLTALQPQYLSVPAELAGVIGVGATAPVIQRNFDQLASYSNYGWRGLPFGGVPLFAPGGDLVAGGVEEDLIISACSHFTHFGCGPKSYLIGGGTSFASPMVSGEAAVVRSIVGRSVGASFLSSSCVFTGTDVIGPSSTFGRGRMNVMKAASCAGRESRGALAN